jgi:hypothetical protein
VTRVYAPTTPRRLRAALEADSFGLALQCHAVTSAVQAALPDQDHEQWEHAAAEVAAQQSVSLLAPDEPARRMVLALDVPTVTELATDDPTAVEVGGEVPLQRLAAVMSDAPDAEVAVAAARSATGSADADRLLEACLDHELGWWAAQELDLLLDSIG